MPIWVLVVYGLAVARLTGLIVVDDITEPARTAVVRRIGDATPRARFLRELLSCQWCVSIWIAAAVAPFAYWLAGTPGVLIPAAALAFSQITGMISSVGRG
jgi:hypothetical protein